LTEKKTLTLILHTQQDAKTQDEEKVNGNISRSSLSFGAFFYYFISRKFTIYSTNGAMALK
jgi:hypothetical protein